jgi:MFS family permease
MNHSSGLRLRIMTTGNTTSSKKRNGVSERVAALKSFNVRSYLLGSSLWYIGTFTQGFAQWWLVLTLSGNRTALPITIGLQAVPLLLLGTWGGTVVDRFDNRRLLGVTTMLNMVAAIGLGVIVASGHTTVGIVYVFSLLSGMLLVFERPALQAILSELAQPDEISSAIGLNAMVQPLSRLVGPPLARLVRARAWCWPGCGMPVEIRWLVRCCCRCSSSGWPDSTFRW